MSNTAPYSKSGLLVLVIVLAVFAGMGLFYISTKHGVASPEQQMLVTATPTPGAANITPPATQPAQTPAPEAVAPQAGTPAPEAVPAPTTPAVIDLAAAKAPRTLGDKNAPVKMVEYSSLTCPHCGHFHKETLGKIKEAYIDTGKVYFEFIDFPLNAPALRASMVAHCLPAERYYPFTQLLFENQDKWAYDEDFMKYLKQNAQLAGLSGEQFDACVANKDLETFITKREEDAQKGKNINSTPSFIINDNKPINGALPYDDFAKAIDAELAKKK